MSRKSILIYKKCELQWRSTKYLIEKSLEWEHSIPVTCGYMKEESYEHTLNPYSWTEWLPYTTASRSQRVLYCFYLPGYLVNSMLPACLLIFYFLLSRIRYTGTVLTFPDRTECAHNRIVSKHITLQWLINLGGHLRGAMILASDSGIYEVKS